ncbi:MAG: HAMP domain-containing histidine kinase [Clostridia bacterium]|nr:HAMP domain-containing histidine kinase [Clostridia bacterium]
MIDFSEIAEKTAGEFAEVAERKNVAFKTSFAPDAIVMGSREQLARLVSVLTENASKYVSNGGEIDIRLEKTSKNAVFTIYNTAEIKKDIDCARLFDRFYRADNSHSSETGGHGIGLSIAAKIATQHGGTLSAKQVKDGIIFTASLPLAAKAKKTSVGGEENARNKH